MKEKIVRSKYFIPACYSLFFVSVFLVSLYLKFPVESVKQRIIYEIEKNTPFKADIKNVNVYPIFCLKIHDMKLYHKAKESYLDINELKLSPSILYLILGKLKLPYKANLMEGEAKGSFIYSFKTKQIEKVEANLAGINIEKISSIIPTNNFGKQGPTILGVLNGGFSFDLGSQTKGNFDFSISNLTLSNIRVRDFPLPSFSNLESNFKGYIENKITRVEEIKFKGDGINLMASGTMPILWNIKRGDKIDLGLRLELKGTKLAGIKTFLASHLAPQGDGSLGGKIAGTVGNLRVVKE
jgi:type II secretion system protein N